MSCVGKVSLFCAIIIFLCFIGVSCLFNAGAVLIAYAVVALFIVEKRYFLFDLYLDVGPDMKG